MSPVIRRVLEAPPALIVVTIIVFGLARVAGGTPIDNLVGPEATPELREKLAHDYGLDQPAAAQYVFWLAHVLRGDLGTSILTAQPVWTEIARRFPATLVLATVGMLFGLTVGLPLGMLSARTRNSWPDHVIRAVTSLILSVPTFVVGLLLILIVGVQLRILPTSGAPPFDAGIGAALPYYVLPVLTLGARRMADVSRLFRSTLLDIMNEDYLRTARAKGLSELRVLLGHAAPNALLPVVTSAAIDYAYLLGGAVIIEAIFGVSGIGTLLLTAIARRDFPLIQGILLVVAVAFLVTNLIADVLLTVIDPRARGR